jgi:hypothetical protein
MLGLPLPLPQNVIQGRELVLVVILVISPEKETLEWCVV